MLFKKKPQTQYNTSNQWIGDNPAAQYADANLYGRFSNGFAVYGPYMRPDQPIGGAGLHYTRQLALTAPQIVGPQTVTPVAITGDGSNLSGNFGVLPLLDLNNAAPGN